MELSKWLDEVPGRTKELAQRLGVTPSAVSQWRSGGVPLRHMQAVRSITVGAVTIEEMVAAKTAARNEGDHA